MIVSHSKDHQESPHEQLSIDTGMYEYQYSYIAVSHP